MKRQILYDPACEELARHFVSIPNDDAKDAQYERRVQRVAKAIQSAVADEMNDFDDEND